MEGTFLLPFANATALLAGMERQDGVCEAEDAAYFAGDCKIKGEAKSIMRPDKRGSVVLVEPADGSSFDSRIRHVVSADLFHAKVVADEWSLDETLSAMEDGAQYAVIVCAPLSVAGSAAEVLYRVRASGRNAAFVGYGEFNKEAITQLLRLGADDVLPTAISDEDFTDVMQRAVRRATSRMHEEEREITAGAELEYLERSLREKDAILRGMRELAIEALLMALAVREAGAISHCKRVKAYALHLAACSGYPERMRDSLGDAALLHDVGKVGLADEFLCRNGWLTRSDLRPVEPHTEFGARIVERIDLLQHLAPILRHHHERFDGEGFPDGLAGEAIPLGARIFSIVDALDAMTSDKPYRSAMTFEVAAEEIQRCAGKQFDPRLVEHFLSVESETWRSMADGATKDLRGWPPLSLLPTTMPFAATA